MATVLGFYGFVFLFVQLCLAIQAGNYGFGLVSIEESELTADFLLSKPVSRAQILTGKLLAALTSLLVTALVLWVSTLVCHRPLPRRSQLRSRDAAPPAVSASQSSSSSSCPLAW